MNQAYGNINKSDYDLRMITILAGTNRPEANSLKVAKHLSKAYAAEGAECQILDLAKLPPAIFDPSAYAEKPEGFQPFADMVLEADGLHVVTPEYNGGFPGVLKYFIDMLPFPESFEGRAVAFTGVAAGQFGAMRPVEQLQQIFGYRNAHIFPQRVFLMGVHNLIGDDGSVSDEKTRERLDAQAKGFAEYVAKLKG
jgi:Predicted flavoprotein